MRRPSDTPELRAEVEVEAAGLHPDQWIGGEFNFDDWLSDCLLTGHIEKVSLPRHGEIPWFRGAYEVGRGDAMTAVGSAGATPVSRI